MAYMSGTDAHAHDIPTTLVPLLLIVFSGYANFVLSGYFKDIEADRQTGYNTFPVVFGRPPASLASDLFAACAIAGLALHLAIVWTGDPSISTVAPAALFGFWGIVLAVRAQVLLHRNREDRTAHTPIRLVVQSYMLMLSAAIAALHPWWSVFLAAFYGAFLLVLRYRTEESQI
jgi:4-hydroxybenzoate polyprenyltransferase